LNAVTDLYRSPKTTATKDIIYPHTIKDDVVRLQRELKRRLDWFSDVEPFKSDKKNLVTKEQYERDPEGYEGTLKIRDDALTDEERRSGGHAEYYNAPALERY